MKNAISMQKLVDAPSPYKQFLNETKELVGKWNPTGLLAGLDTEHEVNGMAIMLENQSRQLVTESTKTGGDNAEQWAGVALPLVRRIFGEIAAKEFVSVQPMNLPAGLVFYLDFKYGTANQPKFPLNSSVYGGSGNKFGRTDSATNGLYGPGRFGYTINDFTSSSLTGTVASASWYDAEFAPELSASAADNTLKRLTVTLGSDVDKEGIRAFSISGSGITEFYPAHTAAVANGTGYDVVFLITASASQANISGCSVAYHKQPQANTRGDFEDASTAGSYNQLDIPEIELQMRSEPIVAKTRKLKAVWTPEMAQDLNAFQSVDAEAELTSMLSEYISMEIDLEILDMLMTNSLTEEFWSAKVGVEYNANSRTFTTDAITQATSFYNRQTWYQTLGTKIQKVSNKIHQLTMRGGANFIVTSPDIATILESIPGFQVDTNGDKSQFAMGVSKVGTFASRFTIYKNPYMTDNVLLMGFKGTTFLETGAVYAPYVPLIMTPLVYDPNNLTPRKGVMTRYAKKVVRPEFFGRIIVEGLNTL